MAADLAERLVWTFVAVLSRHWPAPSCRGRRDLVHEIIEPGFGYRIARELSSLDVEGSLRRSSVRQADHP